MPKAVVAAAVALAATPDTQTSPEPVVEGEAPPVVTEVVSKEAAPPAPGFEPVQEPAPEAEVAAATPPPVVEAPAPIAPPAPAKRRWAEVTTPVKPRAPVVPAPVVAEVSETPEEVPAVKEWVFVKNIHPFENVVTKSGATVTFTKGKFTTTDTALALQIVEVAERFSIVLQ